MKKIFAISFLSVMAVVATADAWANEGLNLNLATAQYVDDVREDLYDRIVDKYEVVNSQGQSWAGWDIKSRVENNPDDYIPTVAHMDAAIANAKPDTSGLVEKAQIIKSDDKALSDGTTDLSSANADQIVPTVANVEANFAPRIGDAVYQGRPYNNDSTVGEIDVTNLPSGEYSVIVSVDRSGNVSFRWVPIQIDSCTTTDGGTCGPA